MPTAGDCLSAVAAIALTPFRAGPGAALLVLGVRAAHVIRFCHAPSGIPPDVALVGTGVDELPSAGLAWLSRRHRVSRVESRLTSCNPCAGKARFVTGIPGPPWQSPMI